MKIPETNTNVGAYYGNEDNGQWQPNGLIVDGAGAAGGDAGFIHHPGYPVPRHVAAQGYVMAGAYYEPAQYAAPHDDFADYMWMENEEEFDKQVMQQLEEEALMEQCIEAMLEDERRERGGHNGSSNTSRVSVETVSRSTLNPLAAEFVPTFTIKERPAEVSAATESRPEASKSETEDSSAKETKDNATVEDSTGETQTKLTETSTQESTEGQEKRPKEAKKETKITKNEAKKTPAKTESKTEVKSVKTTPVCSDTKVTAPAAKKDNSVCKKEVKTPNCVERLDETSTTDVTDASTSPSAAEPSTGFKPFNYAAAAKAKPKKATSPPVVEKPAPQTTKTERPLTATKSVDKVDRTTKSDKTTAKDQGKTTKQAEKLRKNSAK